MLIPEPKSRISEIFFCLFIRAVHSPRDRDSVSGGGAEREREREGGRERLPDRFHAASTEPNTGLDLTTVRS